MSKNQRFGHAGQMIDHLTDMEEKERLEKIMSGPLPRLLSIPLPIESYVTASNLFSFYPQYHHLLKGMDPDGYHKHMAASPTNTVTPVPSEVFNLTEAHGIRPEDYIKGGKFDHASWDKISDHLKEEAQQIREDLNSEALGCRVTSFTHHYTITGITDEPVECSQVCISLPYSYPSATKINKDNLPEMVRDHQGSERMAAYLLARQLITPDDIVREHGASYLVRACSEENAAIIKEKFGLEVPVTMARHYLHDARRKGKISRERTPLEIELDVTHRELSKMKNVLLIEENHGSACVFQHMLSHAFPPENQLHWRVARDYKEAYDALIDPKERFDAIVVDNATPKINPYQSHQDSYSGADLVRMIRNGKLFTPRTELPLDDIAQRPVDGAQVLDIARYQKTPICWYDTDHPEKQLKDEFAKLDYLAASHNGTFAGYKMHTDFSKINFLARKLGGKEREEISSLGIRARPITPETVNENRGPGVSRAKQEES